jgi:hypothetical protein
MDLLAEEMSCREISGISQPLPFLPQTVIILYYSRLSTRSKHSTFFTGRPLSQISLTII